MNHEWAQANSIKVSLSTLRRFCNENQLSTNPCRMSIEKWYNENLSDKDNLIYAENNNIKTSQRSLYIYCLKHEIKKNKK